MPQLDPTWFYSQIFWLVASFSLLYFVLSAKVLPQLSGTINNRRQTINGDIEAAESAKNIAEKAREDYEHLLAQSREMAQGLINESIAENKKHSDETLRLTDKDIAKKLEDAASRINSRKQELIHALTPAAAEFSSMIVEKITKQTVDVEQSNRIVMEMLKERLELR